MSAQSSVIGGIGKPRFLLVGPELSPNVSFEENEVGVTIGGVRTLDANAPFGDYVLRIEDDDAGFHESCRIEIETGADIATKKFIAIWYARSDTENDQHMHINITDMSNSVDLQKDELVGRHWEQFIHEIYVPADKTGEDLTYTIAPHARAQGAGGTGAIRFDNFRFREIFDEYTLPLPSRGNSDDGFAEYRQAENELLNGSFKTYILGYRYFYRAAYERLTAAQEILRRSTLSREYDLLFFPHSDAQNAYFVRWDDDVENSWAQGMAELGHSGNIALVGTELVPNLPTQIIDPLTAYSPIEEEIIIEGEDVYIEE